MIIALLVLDFKITAFLTTSIIDQKYKYNQIKTILKYIKKKNLILTNNKLKSKNAINN